MHRYSPKLRAEIGKYASTHGVQAASNHFSWKLSKNIPKPTVRSISKAYMESLRQKRKVGSSAEVKTLPAKKRGRLLMLGEDIDKQLQLYLQKVRDQGGVITASVVVAAARGILLSNDRSKLVEFGGHIELSRQWAYSVLTRMKFVRRKATTSKSKHTPANFEQLKGFLNDVVSVVTMEEIPPQLILNWDQTGIHLVPASSWTMDKRGSKRVEIKGVNDKRQITAVFCGSLTGDFLPIQVIYKGKTNRCHPKFAFPSDWHVTHSPKHWSTEETMVQYIEHIIIPYVEKQREMLGDKPALVIMDNFKGQVTTKINDLLEANNIHVCLLPPNTTDTLQPMDMSVNKPAKDYLKRSFEQWYSDEVMKQLTGEADIESMEIEPIDLRLAAVKEMTAKWLVDMAKYISDNPHITVSGFLRSGIPGALDGFNAEFEADNELFGDEIISDDEFE